MPWWAWFGLGVLAGVFVVSVALAGWLSKAAKL